MRAKLLLLCLAVGCGGSNGDGGPDGGTPDTPDQDVPPTCGNSILDFGEACDDSNNADGDGCSGDCSAVEQGHACGAAGLPCVITQVCGNGLIEDLEQCDDRNVVSSDGCSAGCTLEAGWKCLTAGIRCVADLCGDGIVAGFEACDDGASTTAGCTSCQLDDGFQCPTPNTSCTATVCGDGLREGTEQCDDGALAGSTAVPNNNLGDGCTPLCAREPQCTNGTCTSVCGDGAIQAGEACDDGNSVDFDGCSGLCAVEEGFACNPSTTVEPDPLLVTVVLRDFKGNDLAGGHVDFQNINQSQQGMVQVALVNGKPNLIDANTYGSAHTSIQNRASFDQWYRDGALAKTVVVQLPMARIAAGTYEFDDGTFFPLDGKGWQDPALVPVVADREISRGSGSHNFSFTSELRYWFKWNGTENLKFRGDDDVWVFVNGKLAVDLGGVHSAENADITLTTQFNTDKALGMTAGGTYEVVVFQAERHTGASSYRLTLKGFNTQKSVCDDVCGDGVTSAYEVCDDMVNMGGYGSCTADCLGFGPRCGDSVVQASDGEECDEGVNLGGYDNCLPTCKLGPRCGDGIVQPDRESCDDGNTAGGDQCPANCAGIIL